MKKRPRPVLCSSLILSMVLLFSVLVEAGPPRGSVWRAARYGSAAQKGNAVVYSIASSRRNILIRDPFQKNSFTMTIVNRDRPGCHVGMGFEIAVPCISVLLNGGMVLPPSA